MSRIERQSRLRPPHSYRDWSRLLCAPQEGVNHRDMARIDEAFRLAREAMAVGMRYNSERVLQGTRQFRRGYAGPVTAQVHDFDQRLRATFS